MMFVCFAKPAQKKLSMAIKLAELKLNKRKINDALRMGAHQMKNKTTIQYIYPDHYQYEY